MSWQTLYLCGFLVKVDSFAAFIFFSTFFVYNFHSFSNKLVQEPFKYFFHLADRQISLTQRAAVIIGLIGSAISFFLISSKAQWMCFFFALITIAYTLPLIRLKGRRRRLREMSYIKMFTVASVWSFITVLLPVEEHRVYLPISLFWILFIERLLFVYSITIPFEIRDMEQEQNIGVQTLPAIHGIKKSKRLGYALLAVFAVLSLIHQLNFPPYNIAIPFTLSAILAGALIYFTNEKRNKWYYKGWIDGTMMIQFFLLLIFNWS